MIHVTETQIRIMEALARYRYLTARQMVAIGIARNVETIHRAVRGMRPDRCPLVGRRDFAPLPGVGRIPGLHYLCEHGRRFLVGEIGLDPAEIRYPKGTSTLFQRKYHHGVGLVDFHIAWTRMAERRGFRELLFVNDFDFTGANRGGGAPRTAKARIPVSGHRTGAIIPDTVVHYEEPGGRQRLFLYELTNGKDAKRVVPQILGHALAISQEAPQRAFGSEVAGRVLLAFEHQTTLDRTKALFLEDERFGALHDWFLFGLHDRATTEPDYAWHRADGASTRAFQ